MRCRCYYEFLAKRFVIYWIEINLINKICRFWHQNLIDREVPMFALAMIRHCVRCTTETIGHMNMIREPGNNNYSCRTQTPHNLQLSQWGRGTDYHDKAGHFVVDRRSSGLVEQPFAWVSSLVTPAMVSTYVKRPAQLSTNYHCLSTVGKG